jgi:hypothetical protein
VASDCEQDDAEAIEDLELDGTEPDIDEVVGGSIARPPAPGGPVPIPYPNTGT